MIENRKDVAKYSSDLDLCWRLPCTHSACSPRLEKVEYDDGRRYRILFNEVLGSGAQAEVARSEFEISGSKSE